MGYKYNTHYYRVYDKDPEKNIVYKFTFVYSLDQSHMYKSFDKLNRKLTFIKIIS